MSMQQIAGIIEVAWKSDIIKGVLLLVVFDTVFGLIRCIKERKFNSCFGIDGAIRKVSMLVSVAFLLILDQIVKLNLIGFIPEEVRQYIMGGKIGAAEFFGLLFIAYEAVSILKNMTLCGLPVRGVWEAVEKFLRRYTNELPDSDDDKDEDD